MKIIFKKDDIFIDEDKICSYSDFSTEDGYKKLFILLKRCVLNDNLEFNTTPDCSPFGKKLKEILSSEFSQNDEF